jgi:GTPase SAR1 family protein
MAHSFPYTLVKQFLTALDRPVHIINLDPAVTDPPYPCAISITSLITLDQVMEDYGLGPNGAILYCIEYLEANFDWLVEQLDELLGDGGDGYVIFDTPGQVELWTNHDSLKNVVEKLQKMDYRVCQLPPVGRLADGLARSCTPVGCSLHC